MVAGGEAVGMDAQGEPARPSAVVRADGHGIRSGGPASHFMAAGVEQWRSPGVALRLPQSGRDRFTPHSTAGDESSRKSGASPQTGDSS